ncbi:hypothetical protein C8R44DRAFT_787690 [Mycena epipterygia]|nr:hypothetical protein C8R44DRAFT_787690 [Mycena epipterygia]
MHPPSPPLRPCAASLPLEAGQSSPRPHARSALSSPQAPMRSFPIPLHPCLLARASSSALPRVVPPPYSRPVFPLPPSVHAPSHPRILVLPLSSPHAYILLIPVPVAFTPSLFLFFDGRISRARGGRCIGGTIDLGIS